MDNFDKLKKKCLTLNRPWVTKGLSKSIAIKNKIYKKFLKAKDPILKNRLHNEFKRRRNIISNLLKKSKQNHYTKFFENNLANLKSTWKGIKELIRFGSNKSNPTIDLEINGKLETDTSNHFHNYFFTIANNLSNRIKASKHSFDYYLNNPNPNSIYIEPITKEETLDYIKATLKPNKKSTGPNNLPSTLLKAVSDIICSPLSTIINSSFNNGIYPDFFKLAKVIPIFKKGSKIDCSNYQNISAIKYRKDF